MSADHVRSDEDLPARLRRIAADFDASVAGYDPASIRAVDNWRAWRHRDMVALVDRITSGTGGTPGHEWSRIGARITEDFAAFDRELSAALGSGWRGAAADSAAAATTPVGAWGQALGQVTAVTGIRMLAADLAARQAKTNLPEPRDLDWQRALFSPTPEQDLFDQHTELENAKAEAVRVMDAFITAGYREADATVPAFPDPPGLVRGAAPVEYGPGGAYAGTPVGGAGYPMWTGLGVPVPYTEPVTAAPVDPAQVQAPAPTAHQPPVAAPVDLAISQEVTTQTSAASVFGPGGAPAAVSAGGQGGPAGGGPVAPTPSQEAVNGGAAVGSRRGPVQPGTTQAFARPLAEAPRPAAAASGAAGMPMGGGGAGGRPEGDAEHRSRYVVEEDKDDLFSHGLSSVTPVIGETR
ncbi:PPE domain-containing protein [Actinokineospora spheciospongiae]|uniref:PPE domain-containing protein n=1 Tax=Actinokineospora spheciospongiae TaxID=909613 RepID=UPI000D70D073|nr:hypothetical protein [Actinokineospora spheciospongiae]PWW65523.1 hypothetical protein DFQ13_102275 [Actinokineospora spheciospongiae]